MLVAAVAVVSRVPVDVGVGGRLEGVAEVGGLGEVGRGRAEARVAAFRASKEAAQGGDLFVAVRLAPRVRREREPVEPRSERPRACGAEAVYVGRVVEEPAQESLEVAAAPGVLSPEPPAPAP